jgi:hypothetical protein
MDESMKEQIRIRAHELWEQAGRPDGREEEFWYEAERDIKREMEDGSAIAQRPEPMSFPQDY